MSSFVTCVFSHLWKYSKLKYPTVKHSQPFLEKSFSLHVVHDVLYYDHYDACIIHNTIIVSSVHIVFFHVFKRRLDRKTKSIAFTLDACLVGRESAVNSRRYHLSFVSVHEVLIIICECCVIVSSGQISQTFKSLTGLSFILRFPFNSTM